MIGSFVELLAGQAPREAYEQLVADAERAGDPAAGTLRALLPQALQVRDTLERQRTREAELSALYATAQDLTAIRDVQQILQAIVRRARQLLGTDIAYLGLNVPEDDAAYIQVTDGAVSASFRNLKLPLGTGLLGLVAQTGVPYATPDYHHDDRFTHRDYIDDAVGDESIRAILGVPMTVNGEVIGALLAANRTPRPFPPEEVELLSSFAAHAAVALENARLFQQTVTSSERVREQSAAVQAAADVHDRLTRVLLRGGDAGDVAAVLADALAATVTVLAPDGRLLAGAGAGTDGGGRRTRPRRRERGADHRSVGTHRRREPRGGRGRRHRPPRHPGGGRPVRADRGRAAHARAGRPGHRAAAAVRPHGRRGGGPGPRGPAGRPAGRRRPAPDR